MACDATSTTSSTGLQSIKKEGEDKKKRAWDFAAYKRHNTVMETIHRCCALRYRPEAFSILFPKIIIVIYGQCIGQHLRRDAAICRQANAKA